MHLTLPLLGLLALSSQTTTAALLPTRQLYQFPNSTFIENIAVQPNGHLLLTTFGEGKLYDLDPATQVMRMTAAIPGMTGLTGVAAPAAAGPPPGGRYVVSAGVIQAEAFRFVGNSSSFWTVDFHHHHDDHQRTATAAACRGGSGAPAPPTVSLLARAPDAVILNGMTPLPLSPHLVLSAESYTGQILRVDTRSGEVSLAFRDDALAADPGGVVPLGVNGICVHGNYMYFTNSAKGTFGQVGIDLGDGSKKGKVEILARLGSTSGEGVPQAWDDFVVVGGGEEGFVYVTQHPDKLVRISLQSGEQTVVVGGGGAANGSALYDPTSVALSRDGKKAYVVTGGNTLNGVVRGGQVVEVDLL